MRGLFPPKLAVFQQYFLAFLCVVLLGSCGPTHAGPEPDTLRVNLGTEPPGLDWDVSTDSTSFDVVSNLMIGLTQYTAKLTCAPGCAASWEIGDGGKRYLFHLRKDVFWTDGKPVVARDFEYSWKRLLDPKTGAEYGYLFYDIVNAYTFEVRLRKPAAYFIYLTAICPSYPQRQDVIEQWGNRWTDPEHMVTNGPYMLSKWAHEYKIELAANPRFFEGERPLKRIKMFMVSEQSTAFALYENDQLDFIDNRSFSSSDVERYCKSPEYRNVALLRNNYLGFNNTKKPFDDARVRRAFSMALDRRIFGKILRRDEKPAFTWIPPGMEGYEKSSAITFDPAQARRLLAEAGYPGGKGFPKVHMLFPGREDTQIVCEQLQDQIKRNLGIKINLQNEEWKVYLEHLHRDPPEIFRGTWGADYPDPETFMNVFTAKSGNNHLAYANPVYDALVERASSEQEPNLRAKLYAQADKLLTVQDAALAPMFQATQNAMVKPWVKGLEFNACDIQFFKNVRIIMP